MKRAVYFFCPLPELDVVASNVLGMLHRKLPMQASGLVVDGMDAQYYVDENGNRFDFVSCAYYFSHRYEQYLDMACRHFDDYDVAGYINWHGGTGAPDNVLTVHTIGDVATGRFAPSRPDYMHMLASAIESGRVAYGLSHFTTQTEATHWSGAIHGSDPTLIESFRAPLFDIEIGSTPSAWANPSAAQVLAEALLSVFDDAPKPKVVLCLGGIHFDPTYSAALISQEVAISIGHFLPTIWLTEGDYTAERGLAMLHHAKSTIVGGVDAIVYNDNMPKAVKDCVRDFAVQTGLQLLKHRRLRTPRDIEW